MNLRSKVLFLLILFSGLIYRFYFIKLTHQSLAFDEVQYKDYADSIKTFGLYAHSFRLYGYPVFIFIIENIFGKLKILGLAPWQFVQFILDIVNTVLIFSTARVLFKNLTAAFITFVVYLFNPFTTAYTGVMLPEILAISIALLASR